MDLKTCLSLGKTKEKEVLIILKRKYPLAYLTDGYCPAGDIFIPELGIYIEVKYDIVSDRTNNWGIEVLCNGKPSGISTSQSKYWVLCDAKTYNWVALESIYQCIAENCISITVHKGEFERGNIIEMYSYLIPKKILKKYYL